MINATELRIINLVEYNGEYYKFGELFYTTNNKHCNPIPLTEEWEDKCGIVHKTVMGNSYTTRFINDYGIPDHIQYVHELQNWYYWTFNKNELTIK